MSSGAIASLAAIVRRLRQARELRKYNPRTIAEHLRRQGAQIGDDCYIVPTSLGTEPYMVKLGNHVAIAQGVQFITHDGAAWVFRREVSDLQIFGPIVIEDNCMIGQNSVLFPNIRIGPNSIIGAGSVVIGDIPPDTIAMGVPARPFGSMDRYREKCLERWREQRPADAVVDADETWWTAKQFDQNRERLKRHLLEVFREKLS